MTLLGGTALAPPASAIARRSAAKIGVLLIAGRAPLRNLFVANLRDLGYVEGKNIHIELRAAQGQAVLLAVALTTKFERVTAEPVRIAMPTALLACADEDIARCVTVRRPRVPPPYRPRPNRRSP